MYPYKYDSKRTSRDFDSPEHPPHRHPRDGAASHAGHSGGAHVTQAGGSGGAYAGPSGWGPSSQAGPSGWGPTSQAGPSGWRPSSQAGPSGWRPSSQAGPSGWRPSSQAGPSGWRPSSQAGPSDWGPTSQAGYSGGYGASRPGPSRPNVIQAGPSSYTWHSSQLRNVEDRDHSGSKSFVQKASDKGTDKDKDKKSSKQKFTDPAQSQERRIKEIKREKPDGDESEAKAMRITAGPRRPIIITRGEYPKQPSVSVASSGSRSVWSEHISTTGKKYYYNCITEKSQWERPSESELRRSSYHEPQRAARSSAGRDLGPSVDSTTDAEGRSRAHKRSHSRDRSESRYGSRERVYGHRLPYGPDFVIDHSDSAKSEPHHSQRRFGGRHTATSTATMSVTSSTDWVPRESRRPTRTPPRMHTSMPTMMPPPPRDAGSPAPTRAAGLPSPTPSRPAGPRTYSRAAGLASPTPSRPVGLRTYSRAAGLPSPTPSRAAGTRTYSRATGLPSPMPSRNAGLPTPMQEAAEPSTSQAFPGFPGLSLPRNLSSLGTYSAVVGTVPVEAPMLSPSLRAFVRQDLVAHVANEDTDEIERQADQWRKEAHLLACVLCSKMAVELKVARAVVRHNEITCTLQEQKSLYLRQQIVRLVCMKTIEPFSWEEE